MSIVIADEAYTPVEVNLWGNLFETVCVTRSLQIKLRELLEREDDAQDDDTEVGYIGELLDIRLRPAAGGKKKASTVIKAKWKADEVTKVRLYQLLRDLEEADHPL